MKWIKASERKPIKEDYKGQVIVFRCNGMAFTGWYEAQSDCFEDVKEGEFPVGSVEWLDESNEPEPAPQPLDVEKAAMNYHSKMPLSERDSQLKLMYFKAGARWKESTTKQSSEEEKDAVHNWFELSYAQYLTIPRSVLQSMPNEWQQQFVKCLNELDETIDWRPKEGRYWVRLKNERGQYMHDDFMDYERGRRKIPSKSPQQDTQTNRKVKE